MTFGRSTLAHEHRRRYSPACKYAPFILVALTFAIEFRGVVGEDDTSAEAQHLPRPLEVVGSHNFEPGQVNSITLDEVESLAGDYSCILVELFVPWSGQNYRFRQVLRTVAKNLQDYCVVAKIDASEQRNMDALKKSSRDFQLQDSLPNAGCSLHLISGVFTYSYSGMGLPGDIINWASRTHARKEQPCLRLEGVGPVKVEHEARALLRATRSNDVVVLGVFGSNQTQSVRTFMNVARLMAGSRTHVFVAEILDDVDSETSSESEGGQGVYLLEAQAENAWAQTPDDPYNETTLRELISTQSLNATKMQGNDSSSTVSVMSFITDHHPRVLWGRRWDFKANMGRDDLPKIILFGKIEGRISPTDNITDHLLEEFRQAALLYSDALRFVYMDMMDAEFFMKDRLGMDVGYSVAIVDTMSKVHFANPLVKPGEIEVFIREYLDMKLVPFGRSAEQPSLVREGVIDVNATALWDAHTSGRPMAVLFYRPGCVFCSRMHSAFHDLRKLLDSHCITGVTLYKINGLINDIDPMLHSDVVLYPSVRVYKDSDIFAYRGPHEADELLLFIQETLAVQGACSGAESVHIQEHMDEL